MASSRKGKPSGTLPGRPRSARHVSLADLSKRGLSIRRAAAQLGLQPSAVSRRLRSLEEQLGTALFERHSSGVQPTVAGRRFLDRARRALSELDYAARSATSAQKGEAGTLGIAFYPSLAAGLLHKILAEYRAHFPYVEFAFREASPADQLAALRRREVDVAFLSAATDAPGAESEHLWDERISVALAETHPLATREALTWAEIRGEDFVVRAYGSGPVIYAWLAGKLNPGGYAPRIRQYDVCRESLLGLVSAGYGMTVVAGSTTVLAIPGLVFRPVSDEDAVVAVRMAWMKDNDNPALGRFLSRARQVSRRLHPKR